MSVTGEDGVSIPLRLDLEYVDATTDACFAWLKEKYAHLTAVAPSASTVHAAAPPTSPDSDNSDEVKKKPKLSTAELQSIENDLLACDALRWRVFAFPSHPTSPLNSSYRNEPGKKGGSASLTAELHKVKKGKKQTKDTAIGSDEGKTDGVEGSPYALFIRTRATADMKKREKKERLAATAAAAAAAGKETSPAAAAVRATQPPPVKVQVLLEKVVRDEEEARWCRILGEERVPLRSLANDDDASSVCPSMWNWFPRSWRPQLGGYVSAPTRKDSARLLLFPQARHPPVDVRDPAAKQSLSDPQPVPWYLRGSVNWDVEKHNPAADIFAAAEASSADHKPNVSGLSYSVQAAQVRPAPADNNHPHNTLHPHNWADAVEISVAAQQSRTERQYASAREKVQRVTLTEDAAAVKVSQGNPRYSVSLSAAHTTVQNSGVRHQQEAAANGFASAGKTKQKRQHRHSASSHASPPSTDDTIQHLQLQDAYDSTVQNFPLPRFWQRLVQPSQRPSTTTTAATDDADEERGVGTAALKNVPRGQYRVRWSGGPGVEMCSAGAAAGAEWTQQPEVWWTVFGKLWTESWIEVPLPWRLALKLRTQTAITMPLELPTPLALPMVPGTPATAPPGETGSSAHSWLREHPYLWATQGPRWDAALVRGFKNDYSGMHHARRWYSILSAELTMSGAGGRKGGKHGKVISSTSVDGASRREVDEEKSEAAAPAGRWSNTSLTAFANACVVDTLRDYPRASVGFSLTSKIPRLAITPFNEMIPHTFECSFSWFAAFKSNNTGSGGGDGGNGFSVELRSGMEQQQGGSAAAVSSNGAPFLRVSPVETFHHMKCGLTWRFDE